MSARTEPSRVRLCLVGAVLALAAGTLAPGLRPANAATARCTGTAVEDGGSSHGLVGPLQAVGDQICDLGHQDDPVVLRGVNLGTIENLPAGTPTEYDPPTRPEIDQMHDWGADVVRLLLSADLVDHAYLGSTCGFETYDPAYAQYISDVVAWANADKMLVILDLHDTNPNCYWNETNTAARGASESGGLHLAMPGTDVAAALGALTRRFGADPLVAFELYNEPHVCASMNGTVGLNSYHNDRCARHEPSNARFWATGGTVSDQGEIYRAPGMDALYSQVRAATTDLVLVDANDYAGDPASFRALAPTTGIVQVLHFYPCGAQATSACSATQAAAAGRQLAAMTGRLPGGHPRMIDEFGSVLDPQSADTTELRNVVAYLDRVGIGWAAFTWQSCAVDPWGLLAGPPSSLPAPDPNGAPIEAALSQPVG